MSDSSSTISSDRIDERPLTFNFLLRRLAGFACPYGVAAVAIALTLLVSGEILPASWVARLQTAGVGSLYLPAYSDHNYQFKLQTARLRRPDVLIIGGSRVNQFRDWMFGTTSAYNAGQCLYGQGDYRRFLEELGESLPKVVIFSLDFFTFHPQFSRVFEHVSYDDISLSKPRELATILRGMAANPRQLFSVIPPLDPISGNLAIGIEAARTGNGFRIDGSYQYGLLIRHLPNAGGVSIEAGVERVKRGSVPFLPAPNLGVEARAELVRFANYAHSKHVMLVAVTTPMAPAVVEALDKSENHGAWREFNSTEFSDWLTGLGIKYFNFARIETFDGRANEFMDAFHADETAYGRMMMRMLRDPSFKALIPGADPSVFKTLGAR